MLIYSCNQSNNMKSLRMMMVVLCMTIIKNPVYTQESGGFANLEIKNSSGEPMLLGHCNLSMLEQGGYKSWYRPNYSAYQPDSLVIRSLRECIKNKRIDIFLGTWCGDSRREVPRMMKILELAGFQQKLVRLIFVSNEADSYKKSPQHEEAGKNIKRVPTLIVYDDDKEIGRIIEYPVISLEKDLLSILKRENYVPNYSQLR